MWPSKLWTMPIQVARYRLTLIGQRRNFSYFEKNPFTITSSTFLINITNIIHKSLRETMQLFVIKKLFTRLIIKQNSHSYAVNELRKWRHLF